ncbi:MAG: hypothetical protein HY262_10255 [Chloroflexi bacterium]|nr:hypothetical protein [Chloroflexota bacterium]
MSKRHQSSRRKTYGRRQHEVRERQDRGQHLEGFDFELTDWSAAAPADPFAFLDPRNPRVRYALD